MSRRDDRGLTPLRRLARARPPAEVERRVARAALASLGTRRGGATAGLSVARWLAPAVALAAAGVAAVIWTVGPAPAPLPEVKPAPAAGRAAAPAPERWQSSEGRRRVVRLERGHRLTLAPGSTLARLAGDPRRTALRLERGRVDFAVAPLSGGRTFRIKTAHLGVEVVGTRFTVEVDRLCSRVEVHEGIVEVRRQGAGGDVDDHRVERLTAGARRTHCARPALPERLSAGEALVGQALDLVRRGQHPRRALASLQRYLRRHPRGPLAEEALFHAALLHQQLGQPERAQAIARRFGARFGASQRAARLRRLLRQPGPLGNDVPARKKTAQ